MDEGAFDIPSVKRLKWRQLLLYNLLMLIFVCLMIYYVQNDGSVMILSLALCLFVWLLVLRELYTFLTGKFIGTKTGQRMAAFEQYYIGEKRWKRRALVGLISISILAIVITVLAVMMDYGHLELGMHNLMPLIGCWVGFTVGESIRIWSLDDRRIYTDKSIVLVRHCEAEGQSPTASLTEKGFSQADDLSVFLDMMQVDRIISSPYLRAMQSVEPLSHRIHQEIKADERLAERVLSTAYLPDWLEKLQATFDHADLKFEGGESSREATNRGLQVIEEALASRYENTVIATHGGMMSLLLRHYDEKFSFDDWQHLSNPDVFVLHFRDHAIVRVEHLWEEHD